MNEPRTLPQFSVVIASYNRKEYVLQAIESVMAQTFAAHQIIVVIDGSTDGTAAAVSAAHPDVIVFEQENLGPGVAHNSGIALASGNWVCFLDDDDLWHRDKLSVFADYLAAHPGCLAVRNPVWFFADSESGPRNAFGFERDFVAVDSRQCHAAVESGDPSRNDIDYLNIEGHSFPMMLERNRGALSATVVHRDLLIRAGGFCPMQTCGDDWTMFVNVARLTEWHLIRRRLGFCRLHAAQNTADPHNGLYTLVGIANAWWTGRPGPRPMVPKDVISKLKAYGPIYRQAVQVYFWHALRTRQFRAARMIRALASLLLPRRRDRVYAFLPPQITWRWDHYVLRKH